MYQSSYQRSMSQLLEVLETEEYQSGISVFLGHKGTANNSGNGSSCLDYYSVQQDEI
jgi:hypothetical protein